MELRLGYNHEKENVSLNHPKVIQNNNGQYKLPSHQQTLYSHTLEDESKSRSRDINNNYGQQNNYNMENESSLSDASSLEDTSQQRFDSMLIEKHN